MIRRDGHRLVLDGAVTVTNHVALRDALSALLVSDGLRLDWGAVAAVDSSALCLILHCRREATARGHHLDHDNLPLGLTALADLYGVGDLITSTAPPDAPLPGR